MAASLIFEENFVLFHCAYFLTHNDILALVCHRATAKVVRELFQYSHFCLQAFRYTPLRAPSSTKKLVLHFPAMSCVGLRRGNILLINTLAHVSEIRNLESVCLMFDRFPQRMMSSLFYWLRAIWSDMPSEQLRQFDLQVLLPKELQEHILVNWQFRNHPMICAGEWTKPFFIAPWIW